MYHDVGDWKSDTSDTQLYSNTGVEDGNKNNGNKRKCIKILNALFFLNY